MFVGGGGDSASAVLPIDASVAPARVGTAALPRALPVVAGFDWSRPDKRREFLRVRLGTDGRLELFPNQSSGVLTSAVWADGLLDNPPGQAIRTGDVVRYLPLADLIAH